jgi:3-methylcrotonyl-CoA carboxylase alpha subunit
MSRYRLTVESQKHHAEVAVRGDQFSCEIDNQKITGTILHTTPPLYVIRLSDGRILTCDVTAHGPATTISCNGQTWPLTIAEVYGEMSLDNGDDGAATELRAPMPGRIVAIPAAVGAEVKRGDPIIVIEAMKMQNALAAPSTGTLQVIHVKPGDTVEAGQLLAKIE